MMNLPELVKHFKFLSDPLSCSEDERMFLERFLSYELTLREQKKREYLLRMSGIRGVRMLSDFDWTFNPKIPREKVM